MDDIGIYLEFRLLYFYHNYYVIVDKYPEDIKLTTVFFLNWGIYFISATLKKCTDIHVHLT